MQWSRWFIAQWLDPIGTVVGLFTAVLVFLTWFTVQFGERRQRARWFHEVRQHVGARPAILEIDLLPGKSIEASLQQFVSTHEALRNVPPERHYAIRREAFLNPEAMPQFVEELRIVAAKVFASGADTVHLFYAGPAVVAAMVGAEFANGPHMLIYHHGSTPEANAPKAYVSFGPLRHDR